MPIAINDLQERFSAYARAFAGTDGRLPPMLQMKVDHTLRVAADCALLAREMGWKPRACATVESAGLLHDVGRFPQYRDYATFADTRSVDHGDLGAEMLDAHGLLRDYSAAVGEVIRIAVRWHNKRHVPATIQPEALPFVQVVRDADKLDIMQVIGAVLRGDPDLRDPGILLNVDPEGPPTPALLEEIRAGVTGSYGNVRSLIDMKLVGFAWTRDICCLPALRLVRDRRLLEGFADGLAEHPEAGGLVRDLVDAMDSRLA